jgi:hypothetical protein
MASQERATVHPRVCSKVCCCMARPQRSSAYHHRCRVQPLPVLRPRSVLPLNPSSNRCLCWSWGRRPADLGSLHRRRRATRNRLRGEPAISSTARSPCATAARSRTAARLASRSTARSSQGARPLPCRLASR